MRAYVVAQQKNGDTGSVEGKRREQGHCRPVLWGVGWITAKKISAKNICVYFFCSKFWTGFHSQ